jgi:hypothetical protein
MNKLRIFAVIMAAALASGALTLASYRAAVRSMPYTMHFGKDIPIPPWLEHDCSALLRRHSTFWTLTAAVGGAASAAYLLKCNSPFSQTGLTALMWPAIAMPLVGWIAPFLWLAMWFPCGSDLESV